jgi:hypothetical protein
VLLFTLGDTLKLLNAFSFNMVSAPNGKLVWTTLSADEVRSALAGGFESGVGHANTAAVFANELGIEVSMQRITVSLESGDEIIVGQYKGPRLQEGATTLPEGALIDWLRIRIL